MKKFIKISLLCLFLNIFTISNFYHLTNPVFAANAEQQENYKDSKSNNEKSSNVSIKESQIDPEKKAKQTKEIIIAIVCVLTGLGIIAWAYNVAQQGKQYGLKFVFSFSFVLLFINFIILWACVAIEQMEVGIASYILIWLLVFWMNAKKSNYVFSLQYTFVQAIASVFSIILFLLLMNAYNNKRGRP